MSKTGSDQYTEHIHENVVGLVVALATNQRLRLHNVPAVRVELAAGGHLRRLVQTDHGPAVVVRLHRALRHGDEARHHFRGGFLCVARYP